MKELVFLTARLPYPASSGRKNVMYNYCKILHEIYNYNITVISYLEEGDNPDSKPDFIKNVIILPPVSIKKKIRNLLIKTCVKHDWPMQVSLFWSENNATIINKYLETLKPDVVIADMVRMTEYSKGYAGYKIANLDDMISIRYKRQLHHDMRSINPYGAYLYLLPASVQRILREKHIKKFVLYNEVKLLKQYENQIAKSHDKTVFVADREAKILNNELGYENAVAVPLGVDTSYFGEYFGKIEKKKKTIAFLGAMSVAHNEAGAIHFIQNILPLIKEKEPEVQFIVIGGGVTDRLKNLRSDSVAFTGRVEDVRTVVGACEVFVCPLTFGSGIKTKILEAMAMGIPVVTTTIGSENINAVNGRDWIIADDNREFANSVLKLFQDEKKCRDMAECAYNFVEDNFTWQVAEERLKKCLPSGE
ncbi:glycosyltransferase family 4 protein [Enterococcus faecium]|uniref:glycosyltransferase family 4 protein n=1 Tax=Enterococcus faecium TaxID=1352 RepID=UPI003CC528B5